MCAPGAGGGWGGLVGGAMAGLAAKQSSVVAPPSAVMATATDTNPILGANQKAQTAKFGALSTIKTSPQGIQGAGPALVARAGSGAYGTKQKLGS